MGGLLKHGFLYLSIAMVASSAMATSNYLDLRRTLASHSKVLTAPNLPTMGPTPSSPPTSASEVADLANRPAAGSTRSQNRNSSTVSQSTQSVTTTPFSDVRSIEVPTGCATPLERSNFHSFYVDPANGSMNNDGSALAPWSTLEAVVSANLFYDSRKYPSAPIHPGDVIYLRSGNHGSPRLYGIVNSDFVTIKAAPGQVPILAHLEVNGSAKFIFQDLILANTSSTALSRIDQTSTFGASRDLIFIGNTLYAKSDVSSWSPPDWVREAPFAGFLTAGSCMSILGNHFRNLKNGMQIYSNDTIVSGNTIDYFGDDGIDVVGSNVSVKNNVITNNLNINDGNHNDGIQGWTFNNNTNINVVISGNVVINSTRALPFPGSMQGISIFDGAWKNVRITDNTVVCNLWHGVALYASVSMVDATVTNNIVVAADNSHYQTWLGVFKGSSGAPPMNVVVADNLVSNLKISTPGVTASQNHRITNNAKVLQAILDLYNSGRVANYTNFLQLVTGQYR
jgi:hypothetical protein